MRRIDVKAGDRFNQLVVLRDVGVVNGKRKLLCKCSCGAEVMVRLAHVRSGHTKSCGDCGIEYNGERMSVKDWASFAGIPESTLRSRLRTMSIGEALLR